MEEEQVFKTEGLTIGALAERLGEHEYGQTPTEFRKAALDPGILADSGIGEASSKTS